MRIFKNRGDIYISSSRVKGDLEQKLLIAALVFVVAFTAVFLLVFGIKYDFSFKAFVTPEDLKPQQDESEQLLPQVQGKTNLLFLLSNENTDELYACALFQADMDTVSYKSCALSPDTLCGSETLSQIYLSRGAAGVSSGLSRLFGVEIDYYADFNYTDYSDFYDTLGSVNYTVLSEVRYKDTSRYGYNIRVSEGEQTLSGDDAVKLLRYYISHEKNFSAANELILACVSQHINAENYEKSDRIFSKFIECAETNITVRDYTAHRNDLTVLSSETTGVNVYGVNAVYDGSSVISDSVRDIVSSFSK